MEQNGVSGDPFDLERFVTAQNAGFETVLAELRRGRKTSHWMWYVFPQIAGLGHSAMAKRYAVSGLDEARVYLAHPVLGARLVTCTELVLAIAERSIESIFGAPDFMKFQSSMTLFGRAAAANPVFEEALRRYFDGDADAATLRLLQAKAR